MTPRELRRAIREGRFAGTTSGACPGYVQTNLVVLPKSLAPEFRSFCEKNPGPCPLVEETRAGVTSPRVAPGADLRTDVPRYHVYRDGELVGEPAEVMELWRDDLVSFLLGCSFTFENALVRAGLPLRHREEGKVVPMHVTTRQTVTAGRFEGPLVVSMRPVPLERLDEVRAITRRYPEAHGEPVHAGEPSALGIRRLDRPDYGEPVTIREGETPVFWACGVTSQAVVRRARPELLITHAPGHMFVTDEPSEP